MKKALVVFLLAVVTLSFAFAGGQAEKKAEVIKIGFIGPMTGDYANYGVLCNNAVKLAVDEINAAGGINGALVELITEDSEASGEKGLSAIEKLSGSDKIVALVGPVLTGVSFAVSERCQNEGIVMISPSSTHKDITAVGNCIFRTVASDGLQGDVAGTYMAQVMGVKKLAVLYSKNDYSQGLYEGTKASFEAAGGKVVIAEQCQVGDKDFKTQLTKIKAANPDAIYIPNYTAEMAQILEQAAQLGIKTQFVSGDGFSNPEIYNLAKGYTDGVVYVGPTRVKESNDFKEFVARYKKAYGIEPDSFATNSYDATKLLASVFAKGAKTRAEVRAGVEAVKDFVGVTGVINFAPNGDLVAYQGVYKVKGSTPEYLGAFTVVNGKVQKVE